MAEALMTIKNVYDVRPCTVNGTRAIFHRWVDEARTINPSTFERGQFYRVYGLVEFEDGTVQKVDPEDIRFMDTAVQAVHMRKESK